jgi:tRNA(Ile)-lysidine synthase
VVLARPFLAVDRAQTRAACAVLDLTPWDDPHNSDPTFARVRARTLLASLADTLGDAVVGNLAQTARLAAADATLLDTLADAAGVRAAAPDGSLRVADLVELPAALRTRVLHQWAMSLGAPGSALSHRHIDALEALVLDWHGQGPVSLPSGVLVRRQDGLLRLIAAPAATVRGGFRASTPDQAAPDDHR